MENKILEAVKALGGDLANVDNEDLPVKGKHLSREKDGRYLVLYTGVLCDEYICTISEFNTYAEQWLKQAYMHNAALDLDWDVGNSYNYQGDEYLFRNNDTGVYVDSDCDDDCDWEYTLICKSEEFIDYCNANKPCEEVKPEWDGEGLPPVGLRCVIDISGYSSTEFTPDYFGRKYVIGIRHDQNREASFALDCVRFRPIKSPRDKAIDEMIELDLWATDKEYVEAVYDWIKQLTPEQKKEFDL